MPKPILWLCSAFYTRHLSTCLLFLLSCLLMPRLCVTKQCPLQLFSKSLKQNMIQCMRYEHEENVSGHWPLKYSTIHHDVQFVFDQSLKELTVQNDFSDSNLQRFKSGSKLGRCDVSIPSAIMFILPHSQSIISEGATHATFNYYVTHMDVLFPLWSLLRRMRMQGLEPPLLMPFVSSSSSDYSDVNLATAAFESVNTHWMRALQLLSDRKVAPLTTRLFEEAIRSGRRYGVQDFGLCFDRLQLGLPSTHRPRHSALLQFATEFKGVAMTSLTDERDVVSDPLRHERRVCGFVVKRVGLVVRAHGRVIRNEADVVESIAEVGRKWCTEAFSSPRSIVECRVEPVLLHFGRPGSTLESDIQEVQSLAVLMGVQGSGLINGMYLPRTSAVVAVYLDGDWPLSPGHDPLAVVAARGPYRSYINRNASSVECGGEMHLGEHSKHCDNGNITLASEVVHSLVRQALIDHVNECAILL